MCTLSPVQALGAVMMSLRQNSGLVAHTESIRIITHVCTLGCANALENLCVLREMLVRSPLRSMHALVQYVLVEQLVVHEAKRSVPKEGLMTEGVEGGWLVGGCGGLTGYGPQWVEPGTGSYPWRDQPWERMDHGSGAGMDRTLDKASDSIMRVWA